MIGYCPLDEDPIEIPSRRREVAPPTPVEPQAAARPRRSRSFLGEDDTECNFVVMFFIAGVIALAIMDTLPSRK
jgi:hypothetical protein